MGVCWWLIVCKHNKSITMLVKTYMSTPATSVTALLNKSNAMAK